MRRSDMFDRPAGRDHGAEIQGLFKVLGGVGDTFFSTKGQLAMWLMAPVWAGVLSFCFMFRSSARAWGWLALANLVLWGALYMLGGLAV